MTDATHAQGCSKVLARASQMLARYDYCPECRRMVRTTTLPENRNPA